MTDGQVTLACALASEERAARKGGARAARVGIGARLPLPAGPLADIPFELLLALSGDPELEGKPVVQAASATVYLECLKRRREKPNL